MCGVFGAFGVNQPLEALRDMMIASKYRGEQGAGLALISKSGQLYYRKEAGGVERFFDKINSLGWDRTEFYSGIGHLRYGTTGERRSLANTQPLCAYTKWGELFVAHNGDTPNFEKIKKELEEKNVVFSTTSDTEFILHQIALAPGQNFSEALINGLEAYDGTYALTMLLKNKEEIKIIAALDPYANRPLCLGRLNNGYVIASEDSAFEPISAEPLDKIEPGEVLIISASGINRHYLKKANKKLRHCVFEDIYYSFPSSNVFGLPVYKFREGLGRKLAKRYGEQVCRDHIITNPPDSSNCLADGFCKELNHFREGVFVRRHSADISRSFTQETTKKREEVIRKKFSIIGEKVKGKYVWVIEDSVVRGNTARKLIRVLRAKGAKWVGVLAGCPPVIGPCKKGIDLSDNLIAEKYLGFSENYNPWEKDRDILDSSKRLAIKSIAQEIEADFLGYLPLTDVFEVINELGSDSQNFCYGCFTDREPIWDVW